MTDSAPDDLDAILAPLRAAWPAKQHPSAKLTLPTAERVIRWVTDGMDPQTALRGSGITARNTQAWAKQAEAGEQPYAAFAEALVRAEAAGEYWHLRNLRRAAEDDPRYSQWVLERLRPERYAAVARTQALPAPVTVQLPALEPYEPGEPAQLVQGEA